MEIVKTKRNRPPRILLHADHGVGKSSLAAASPSPIFIQLEDGLDNIETDAFPLCRDFETMVTQIHSVINEPHEFKTLVIDSLDWAENAIAASVCKEGNKNSISDFSYGAGFQAVFEKFQRIVKGLNLVREDRGMAVILIAHSQIKTYANPMGADYDRHQIKLREKNAELFLEWADLVGFLHFSTMTTVKKDGFSETTKAIGGKDRVLSCAPSAAYVSKNRYGITQDIMLPSPQEGWNNLVAAIRGTAN